MDLVELERMSAGSGPEDVVALGSQLSADRVGQIAVLSSAAGAPLQPYVA